MIDSETVFVYKAIKKCNPNIQIMTELVCTNNIEYLLFVARDGYPLLKLFDIINDTEIKGLFIDYTKQIYEPDMNKHRLYENTGASDSFIARSGDVLPVCIPRVLMLIFAKISLKRFSYSLTKFLFLSKNSLTK